MSQEVSKRCEESKVSVSKARTRRGLKLIIAADQGSVTGLLESDGLPVAVVCSQQLDLWKGAADGETGYRLYERNNLFCEDPKGG